MSYRQLRLDNQLCFRLYTASRLITQLYEPYFKPLGITYTQYLVLLVLWEHGEQPVNDIGKRLHLGINTISPLIKRMEKQALVARRGGDTDKRQQIVFLTDKGKALEKEAAAIPGCLAEGLAACDITAENMAPLMPALDHLIANLAANSGKEPAP